MANTLEILANVAQHDSPRILREISVFPRLSRVDMDAEERQRKGDTVSFTRQFDSTVRDVVPGVAAPANSMDIEMYRISIKLDQFKESNFRLNDKEFREIKKNQIMPSSYATRLKALSQEVELYQQSHLLLKIPNRVGTVGVIPTDIDPISEAVSVMHTNGADMSNWAMAINSTYAKGLRLSNKILNSEISGTFEGLRQGWIGPIFGFDTVEAPLMEKDANLTMTTGTHSVDAVVNNGPGYAKGDDVITIDGGTGSAKAGEVIFFAGHSQPYVLQLDIANTAAGTFQIFPPLKEVLVDNVAISYQVAQNVTFKVYAFGSAEECLALVTRAWDSGDSSEMEASDEIAILVDEASGLIFRLSKVRGYKQTEFSLDILYGGGVVEPNNGVLIIG